VADNKAKNEKNGSILGDNYLEAIFDNFCDGIYITDGEANTIYLNHSYELITGLTYSDMVGKNMAELVSEGVISHSGSLDVLACGKPVTLEQWFRTGKRAMITSIPVMAGEEEEQRIVLVVTVVREIMQIYSLQKELQRLRQQNLQYVNELRNLRNDPDSRFELVAEDGSTVRMMRMAEKFAVLDEPVFLQGPKGSGKERIARFIHRNSARAERMFMRINFSLIPRENPIGYLFGYTSAENGRYHMGILENMDGGTVYIEELTDITEGEVRSRLLSLLQNQACLLGDNIIHKLDIRFIVGSRYSAEEIRREHHMEPELLERLTELPLQVLPLSRRRDDILPLADYFLKRYMSVSKEKKVFSRECCLKMCAYDWPENIAEMKKAVQHAAILSSGEVIEAEDMILGRDNPGERPPANPYSLTPEILPEHMDLKYELEKMEAAYMQASYERNRNVRQAAKSLGMDSSTYVRKRKKYEDMHLMNHA